MSREDERPLWEYHLPVLSSPISMQPAPVQDDDDEIESDVEEEEELSDDTETSDYSYYRYREYDDDDDNDEESSVRNLGHEIRALYYALAQRLQDKTEDLLEEDVTPDAGRLSKLTSTCPIDILFQIFSALRPTDLLNLCRVDRNFRKHLLSRNATTVWKTARQNLACPAPLEDISEVCWAILIFGRDVCQVCDDKTASLDWAIRRKRCKSCREANLVRERRFVSSFPNYEPSILSLLPFTSKIRAPPTSRYYWLEDIESAAHELQQLKEAPEEDLEAFIQSRKNLRERILQQADICRQWSISYRGLLDQEALLLKEKRKEQIVQRLTVLGYDLKDMSQVLIACHYLETVPFTDRVWRVIQEPVINKVLEHKKRRLREEKEKRFVFRANLLSRWYHTYRSSCKVATLLRLPGVPELIFVPEIRDKLEAPEDVAIIKPEDFSYLHVLMPKIIQDLNEARKTMFRKCLKQHDVDRIFKPLGIDVTLPLPHDTLDLASVYFGCKCASEMVRMFSTADILRHSCRPPQYISLGHLTRPPLTPQILSETAAVLVRLAGFDPLTASVSQLSDLKSAFICEACQPGRRLAYDATSIAYGHVLYNFQQAVQHADNSSIHSFPPGFRMITEDEKARVIPFNSDWALAQKQWMCNHCSFGLTAPQMFITVVSHVQTQHFVQEPRLSEDVVEIPGDAILEQPTRILSTHSITFTCDRCNECKEVSEAVTRDHYRAKHQIEPMHFYSAAQVMNGALSNSLRGPLLHLTSLTQ